MVHISCQLDRILDPPDDGPLDVAVGDYADYNPPTLYPQSPI